jgi:hypothetical protein
MLDIRVTRDSVAMGDDTWAPHEWRFSVHPETTLGELVRMVVADHYLASIAGGLATWTVETGRGRGGSLAVVAEQWQDPRFVVDPGLRTTAVPAAYDPAHGRVDLHVQYHAQRDPDAVLTALSPGLGTAAFNQPVPVRVVRDQPPRPKPPR